MADLKSEEADLRPEGADLRAGGDRIVAKESNGQRYLLPQCEYMWMCDAERGSSPEGVNDLCLISFEALGLNLSIINGI